MQYIPLLLITLLSCAPDTNSSTSKKELVVDITSSNVLVERQYYSGEKQLIRSVIFDQNKHNATPTDSTIFFYDSLGQFKNIVSYEFANGKYKKTDDPTQDEYYANLFSRISDCSDFKNLIPSFPLTNELNDICNITNSTLPDGRDIKDLAKADVQGKDKVIVYDGINAKFNNLSLDLESYFFNQDLSKLVATIKNGALAAESYFFSDGNLTRTYTYENGKVRNINIEAKYNDGTVKQVNRNYSYKMEQY